MKTKLLVLAFCLVSLTACHTPIDGPLAPGENYYLGTVSANKVPDKVKRVGFTITPSPNVDAPIINEYPLTLECKLIRIEDGIVVGKVINQSANESILTNGKVDLSKLKPIVFDASALSYRSVGSIIGKAWGDGKKFL